MKYCNECGELCKVDGGVSNHVDEDGNIDYDADADHVAIPEVTYKYVIDNSDVVCIVQIFSTGEMEIIEEFDTVDQAEEYASVNSISIDGEAGKYL